MATSITFLKNYKGFGRKIRPITATLLYKALLESKDQKDKKVYFLRLFEENISSSEDMLYWACVAYMREQYPPEIKDEWEFLLNVGIGKGITDDILISKLEEMSKLSNGKELLSSFGVENFEEFCKFGGLQMEQVLALAEKLLETVRTCFHNRSVSETALLRSHNKIKHGMVVLDEGEALFIRDYYGKKGSNRNLVIEMDIERAKGLLGTIEANSACIHMIISVCLYHHSLKIMEMGKRGPTDAEKALLRESIEYHY